MHFYLPQLSKAVRLAPAPLSSTSSQTQIPVLTMQCWMQAAVAAARAAAAGEPLPDLPVLKALKPTGSASKKASKLKVKDGAVSKRKASAPAPAAQPKAGGRKSGALATALRLSLETADAAKAGTASKKPGSSAKGKAAKGAHPDSPGSPDKATSNADGPTEPADSDASSDVTHAQGIPDRLFALFSPAKPPVIAPAVTGPSAEEGDTDNHFPLPASFLQLRSCTPAGGVSGSQLTGAGPHPAYPAVPRITAARGLSSEDPAGQASAAGPDAQGQQGVQSMAPPRRIRSRPGGPAVGSVEQAPPKSSSAANAAAAADTRPSPDPAPKPSAAAEPQKSAAQEEIADSPPAKDLQERPTRAALPATSAPVSIDLDDDEPLPLVSQQQQQVPQQVQQQLSGPQPFQMPLFDPFQHQQQQQTALLAHFASLPLHQWGDALGEYQRQALASLASNISAVQQVLAQASLLQQQQQQQATLQGALNKLLPWNAPCRLKLVLGKQLIWA